MTKTFWLLAAVAACGDNALAPVSGDDATPLPSYRVDGFPTEGVPAIACDTRFTIATGVFDCPNTMVDGDPLHWLQTCPDGAGSVAALSIEIWYDDQLRRLRDIEHSLANGSVPIDTTYTYDDIGMHDRIVVGANHAVIQHDTIVSRTASGNPLTRTTDWPLGDFYPPAGHLQDSFSYDADDRLVDISSVMSDGNPFTDFAIGYDDVGSQRILTLHGSAFPGSGPASTSIVYEKVDAFGRLTELTQVPNPYNPARDTDFFYDATSRLSRTVVTNDVGSATTTDYFYECN